MKINRVTDSIDLKTLELGVLIAEYGIDFLGALCGFARVKSKKDSRRGAEIAKEYDEKMRIFMPEKRRTFLLMQCLIEESGGWPV